MRWLTENSISSNNIYNSPHNSHHITSFSNTSELLQNPQNINNIIKNNVNQNNEYIDWEANDIFQIVITKIDRRKIKR